MTDTTFRASAKIQFNVLRALILRDMAGRHGESRLGFLWAMVKPVGTIAIIYGAGVITRQTHVQGMPLLIWLITGYLAWICFEFTFISICGASKFGRPLLMFPHLTLLDTIIALAITEWGMYTVVFLLTSVLAVMVERAPLPAEPLKVLVFFWAASWFGSVMGVMVIVIRRYFSPIDYLIMPVRRLGVLFSGPLVAASLIPPFALKYFSWNPIFGLIEILRQSWYPAYQSPIADARYVLLCLFFLTVTALVTERLTRSKQH